MPPRRVTLLEVAERAGVSRATASLVLAGRDRELRIAEATRQRVLRAAQELDYRPNLMARGLRTKTTNTLALLSDTIATEQYAGRLVQGTLTAAVQHRRLLYVGETEGDRAVEERLIADLLDRQVEGFIYATMYTREVRIPRLLRQQPLVLLNCLADDRRVPSVVPDERAAGRAAVQALLDAGHTGGIHLVGTPAPTVYAARERLAGVEERLAEEGLRLAGVLECEWWPQSGFEAIEEFLATGARPAALVCLNDRLALGAYQAVQRAGLTIPGDVSVVSFDDSDLAAWLQPQLTSVALPHAELGRLAVETLLAPEPAGGVRRIPMPLRRRDSVGPPPR